MSPRANIQTLAVPVSRGRVADYFELLKPRLTSLVLLTTGAGAYVGHAGPLDPAFALLLVNAIVGTALAAGGAMALNQYLERDADARMHRTANRPLPAGRITPAEALAFGLAIAMIGVGYLAWAVNPLVAGLGTLTIATYLFLYTPLKTRTPLCTLAGAIPGAIPPVMGYAAATGTVDLRAWSLFAILFVWQLPHFLAIAWLYREDYARGGQIMLPVVDPTGARTAGQVLLCTLLLIPTAMLPSLTGMTGPLYAFVALPLGAAFLWIAVQFARRRTQALARRLFIGSVVYLPLLLAFLATDHL